MSTRFPDLSQWQGVVDFTELRKATAVVAIRAHNGFQADPYFAHSFAAARAAKFSVILLYGYLPASANAAAAGRSLAATVGTLRRGEALVLDLEEGSGNQSARALAYLAQLPPHRIVYSGQSFFATRLRWIGTVLRWVASWGSTAPSGKWLVWQYSATTSWPGVSHPCDADYYPGTPEQLTEALGWARPVPPKPIPVPPRGYKLGRWSVAYVAKPPWPCDVDRGPALTSTVQWSGHTWRKVSRIPSKSPRWAPDINPSTGHGRVWVRTTWQQIP